MLIKKILLLLTVFLTFQVRAQLSYVLDQGIPLQIGNTSLSMPWAGGLNTPEFNTMDLNGDQHEDLVLFDRQANQILTFLNDQKKYRYAPEYEALFPSPIEQWLLIRDFNCDGKKDIFTSDPFGIRAYVNTTPPGGKLSWRIFNLGFPLLSIGFTHSVNIQVNSSDIPAIDDIDGDGDLDILDARFSGIGSLEYHRNMSKENTGSCDSMQFVRYSQTWGNFEECNCGKYLFGIDSTCSKYGRIQHASGKVSLTLDFNNDGIRDLLFTEENCNNLYLMTNTGTRDTAAVHSAVVFPQNNPIDMQIFPAPYYEDVDFDGVPDLVVTSNISTRNAYTNNFKQSVYLYKNTGTVPFPSFELVKKNFLQDQMVDIGDNAAPAFLDEDGDGDQDLFVGNFYGVGKPASITFFRNEGSLTQPSFTWVTDDYALLSSFACYNLRPQFADVNGDHRTDLIFSATLLADNTTSLYFMLNKSATHLDVQGQPIASIALPIAQRENTLFVDVDRDGLTDVLVGRETGQVEFWINNGPAGQFNLALESSNFLGLGITTARQSAAMAVGDLDGDGTADFLWGDQKGTLRFIRNFRASIVQPIESVFVFNALIDSARSPQLGGRIWPAIANLYTSTRPVIVAGNVLGGLHLLKNDVSQDLPLDPVISVYPNPAPKDDEFLILTDRNMTLSLVSLLGQKFAEDVTINANEPYHFGTRGLAAGIYVIRFTMRGKNYLRKVIVR